MKSPPLKLLPMGGEKGRAKNIFPLNQIPVNIGWQGFSFANYKTILLDNLKN
jgi:hypothetical protein